MQPVALITSTMSVDAIGSPPTLPTIASTRVLVEGRGVLFVGGTWAPHTSTTPAPPPPHIPITVTGSPKVFVEGIPLARAGDLLSCGAVILPAGSSTRVLSG